MGGSRVHREATPQNEAQVTILVSREGIATLIGGPMPMKVVDDDWIAVDHRGPMEGIDARKAAILLGIARRLAVDAFRKQSNGYIDCPARRSRRWGKTPAIEAFAQIVGRCLAEISVNAQLLRRASDREALHQLRVGLRRLRAVLSTFESILPADVLAGWSTEARWFAGRLDHARDLDVFIEYFVSSTGARTSELPIASAFGERLLLAQARAYDLVAAVVGAGRFAAFEREIGEWIGSAPSRRAGSGMGEMPDYGDVSGLAVKSLKRLHRQLRKAGEHLATLAPDDRHRVRIKAKKLKYVASFFGDAFGASTAKQQSKFLSSLTALQDALGELNDLTASRACALGVAGDSAELAFYAGQVIGERNRSERKLVANAVRAYERWISAEPFWT